MRSWPRLAAIALVAAGCGDDARPIDPIDPPVDTCETSYLDYQSFGEPFVLDWCRGCHSSAVPAGMRQLAPIDVNFDNAADIARHKDRIVLRATGATPTMPPAGGPSPEERALLAEWAGCGMK